VYLPFLAWSPDEVLAAYSRQSGRAITPESVWYLLLRPFDLAHVRTHISFSAGAPGWADASATVLQVLAVLAVVGAAVVSRPRLRAAVALAGLAPAAFLLTNRIFSPQFVLVLFAAGNAFVYPFALPWYDITWPLCSALLFFAGLTLTAWLALRAARMSA
jgi:hypothetical protein